MASSTGPRPTLADIGLPARRRLRDGTRSNSLASASAPGSVASSSRSSSVASSLGRGGGRGKRGRSGSTFSTLSAVTSTSTANSALGDHSHPMSTRVASARAGSGTGPRAGLRRSTRSRRSDQSSSADEEIDPTYPTDTDWQGYDDIPATTATATATGVPRVDHGSTLIDMLQAMDRAPTPPEGPEGEGEGEGVGEASSSASSSSAEQRRNAAAGDGHGHGHGHSHGRGRRFTAAEKGKGRAPPAETITISDEDDEDVDVDDSIQVTGVKRKIHSVDDDDEEEEGEDKTDGDQALNGSGQVGMKETEEAGMEAEQEAGGGEEVSADRLGEYKPSQAVVTACGHILCAECLHSSLLAAIARQPNPYPHNQPPPRKPNRRAKKSKQPQPQPAAWTADELRETWLHHREREYEANARAAGMDDASIEAGREVAELAVQMVLKGLWKVDEQYWVIEGECPVCRKGLPGGYAPPGKGVGGVIPLQVKVGGGHGAK